MTLSIRPAVFSDLGVIQELNKALFEWDRERDPGMNFEWPFQPVGEAYFRKRIAGDDQGACFVATESPTDSSEEHVVGYLAGALRRNEVWRTTQRSEVENMFVAESSRRAGTGRALMSAFCAWSKDRGATQILVEAFIGNDAVDFYETVGFRPLAITLQAELGSRET